jgi:pimeloyl-ACP methyl ester carboxylesterase
MAPWVVHEIGSGGESLHVETAGDGSDVLVFCHGLGGTHAVWYQQVAHFAGRYRTITWDARGFGRSTNLSKAATVTTASADLGRVFDALGVERAHVVGQSMGGWTALGFALAQPERVRSLVLTNTLAGVGSGGWAAAARTAPAPPPPSVGSHPALGDTLRRTDPAKAFLYQQLGSALAHPAEALASLFATEFDDAALSALRCRVLMVASDEDRIFPAPLIEASAASIPGARVVTIAGAGHSTYFERPDAWNAAVGRFLEETR